MIYIYLSRQNIIPWEDNYFPYSGTIVEKRIENENYLSVGPPGSTKQTTRA